QPAEQVDFKRWNRQPKRISGYRAAGAAAPATNRVSTGSIELGKLVGTGNRNLRAGRGYVSGGDAQVAVVGQCLEDQQLQACVAEDVAIGIGGKRCLILRQIWIANWPRGRHRKGCRRQLG